MPLPAGAAEPRAVIELFTSQGCSSCPAADKLLGELSRDPTLVTLSLPVDYWDYLGWKDTLALHGHSSRERAYADARGDREVYTPQVVVNGIVPVLGSDKAAIEQAIAKTRQSAAPLTLPVTLTVADGKISVSVPAAVGEHDNAEIWLCPVTGKAQVAVERGENRGHTLTYTNVVRRWVKLGVWTGKVQASACRWPVFPMPIFRAGHRPRGGGRAKRRRRQAGLDARRRRGEFALEHFQPKRNFLSLWPG